MEQDFFSLGGEALVLVYPRSERKVTLDYLSSAEANAVYKEIGMEPVP